MIIATFVLLTGQFAKVFELIGRGIPVHVLFSYVLYRMPQALGFTIPLSIFLASTLVFYRMSVEREMYALFASGISLSQITAPVIGFSFILMVVSFVIQFDIGPDYKYRAKMMVREEGAKHPLFLIDEGRFVELFSGYILYVEEKDEQKMRDVHLYVLDDMYRIKQKIYAEYGEIEVREDQGILECTLHNTLLETVDETDPVNVTKNRRIKGGTLIIPLRYGEALHKKELTRGIREMTGQQLLARIQLCGYHDLDPSSYYVEMYKRMAMVLSPFSFMLLGIPLGIRAPRKESYYRLLICVSIPFLYYCLLSFFENFCYKSDSHVEVLLFLPDMLYQGIGLCLLWKKR